MNRSRLPIAVALLSFFVAGCDTITFWYDHGERELAALVFGSHTAESNPEVKTVAVLPLLHQADTDAPPDAVHFAELFASELVKLGGFSKVIRPGQALAVMKAEGLGTVRDANDVRRIGRLLAVDAVFVGAITDFRPFPPPRIGFAVHVYRTERANFSAADLESLMQTGKPIRVSADSGDYPVLGGEWIFDMSNNRTRNQLERYALAQSGSDRPLGIEAHYRIVENYFRFVTHQTIRYLIEQDEAARRARQKAASDNR